ncbi:MAG: hypothetical protein E6J90_30780 [Deltaproteobacteria bacterium]|nr:MAG: hypothetical protein E6J90_30780 [Deltaproteobacteria bacterium]
MSQPQRSQLAAPVVLVYWLMVLGGLALFTVTRVDNVSDILPLWIGALAGTLLGQFLALHDLRLWVAALVICFTGLYCGPLVPSGQSSAQLWLAFIPSALCGFWSLGDRSALAAMWFPAVLWMLAILDRNDQQLAPDGVAAILLGGLAVLFIWFLHTRESRRVGLWRTVSPEPLAAIEPPQLLREPPGRQLARAGWGLSAGAIAAALTVWLAPPLWRTEDLAGDDIQLAAEPAEGLPCCPLHQRARTESSRVREYLDLGLGHNVHATALREDIDCRVCEPVLVTAPAAGVLVDDVGGQVAGEIGGRVAAVDGVTAAPAVAGDTIWAEPAPSYEPPSLRRPPPSPRRRRRRRRPRPPRRRRRHRVPVPAVMRPHRTATPPTGSARRCCAGSPSPRPPR